MNITDNKYSRDIISIILISILFFLPSIISLSFERNIVEPPFVIYVMPFVYLFVFLINYFYLINKTILQHKKIIYFLLENIILIITLSFAMQLIISYLHSCEIMLPPPPPDNPPFHDIKSDEFHLKIKISSLIRDGIMMLMSASFALALKLSNHSEKIYHKELEINAKHREIQLLNLKAQLNPHFLFNTLNNIYSLISFAPDKAQKAIHDLSSMLRFMIYDSDTTKVSLEKELIFVQDYIELMKLRINPSTRLSISIIKDGIKGYQIVPLIFLTIIENAFKHGLSGNSSDFINIDIHLEQNTIVCSVENSISQSNKDRSDYKGIGVENIKKQLSLVYPDTHSLDISTTENSYKVRLKINLEKNN